MFIKPENEESLYIERMVKEGLDRYFKSKSDKLLERRKQLKEKLFQENCYYQEQINLQKEQEILGRRKKNEEDFIRKKEEKETREREAALKKLEANKLYNDPVFKKIMNKKRCLQIQGDQLSQIELKKKLSQAQLEREKLIEDTLDNPFCKLVKSQDEKSKKEYVDFLKLQMQENLRKKQADAERDNQEEEKMKKFYEEKEILDNQLRQEKRDKIQNSVNCREKIAEDCFRKFEDNRKLNLIDILTESDLQFDSSRGLLKDSKETRRQEFQEYMENYKAIKEFKEKLERTREEAFLEAEKEHLKSKNCLANQVRDERKLEQKNYKSFLEDQIRDKEQRNFDILNSRKQEIYDSHFRVEDVKDRQKVLELKRQYGNELLHEAYLKMNREYDERRELEDFQKKKVADEKEFYDRLNSMSLDSFEELKPNLIAKMLCD